MSFAQGIFGPVPLVVQQMALNQRFQDSPNSMMAGSPFSSYDASVALWVFLIGLLVSVLLMGGFMILNLGLLSRREGDRVGGRSPSDVGILKHNIWPEQKEDWAILPAESDGNFMEKFKEKGEGDQGAGRAA